MGYYGLAGNLSRHKLDEQKARKKITVSHMLRLCDEGSYMRGVIKMMIHV
jgi:hypothetical protein